jgi:hypothetical protein
MDRGVGIEPAILGLTGFFCVIWHGFSLIVVKYLT